MRKSCFTTASRSWLDRKADGPAGAKSSCPNWPTSRGACRCPIRLIGSLVADAFRARGMKFPPKGVCCGSASFHLRSSPERALFGHSSGLAVAVRRQSSAAQGPAGGPADSTLAGRDHDAEESHAHARGAALHRLRARGREAVGEQEIAVGKARDMLPATALVTFGSTRSDGRR